MKLINKDLTRERVWVSITNNQIYARIFSHKSSKWIVDTYFVSYNFEVDSELVESTIKHICRTWGLRNPKVIIE